MFYAHIKKIDGKKSPQTYRKIVWKRIRLPFHEDSFYYKPRFAKVNDELSGYLRTNNKQEGLGDVVALKSNSFSTTASCKELEINDGTTHEMGRVEYRLVLKKIDK